METGATHEFYMTMETEDAPFDFLKAAMLPRRKKSGPDKKYATFNRRMLAATIDSLILMIFTAAPIEKLFPIRSEAVQKYVIDGSDPMAARRWLIRVLTDGEFITSWVMNVSAQALVIFLFSAVCWHFWSATPGKMLLRIKVADAATEQPMTDEQIAFRLCGYCVSSLFFFLGFFWIAFDKRRQGWHDKIANTVVLVIPWKTAEP